VLFGRQETDQLSVSWKWTRLLNVCCSPYKMTEKYFNRKQLYHAHKCIEEECDCQFTASLQLWSLQSGNVVICAPNTQVPGGASRPRSSWMMDLVSRRFRMTSDTTMCTNGLSNTCRMPMLTYTQHPLAPYTQTEPIANSSMAAGRT
jgi:hypothetical protein